jgi:GT2 family glycosyltransferase
MSGRKARTIQWWHRERPAVAIALPMTVMQFRDAVNNRLHWQREWRADDRLMTVNETAAIGDARNAFVRHFLDYPAEVEYLLMVDDDMLVDLHVIERLTVHKQPIVSAVNYMKVSPYRPVAYAEAPAGEKDRTGTEHYGEVQFDYHQLDVPSDAGLLPVDGVGAACLLVHRDVFAAIEPPWFKFEGGGEDLYFCRKARAAGFRILVDTTVHTGHAGVKVATREDWERERSSYIENRELIPLTELRKAS